jgi:Fe-S-cluster formation regulator IscX/YfhJ
MKREQDEVDAELARLNDLQMRVRQFSAFGDDNRRAIGAQIEVLEDWLDEDDVDTRFADEADNVRDAAYEAAAWLSGTTEPGGMSEGWAELT